MPSQRLWRAAERYHALMARTETTLRRSHEVVASAHEALDRAHLAFLRAGTVSESRRRDSEQETLTDDDWPDLLR